jgi:hypothetical protein
MDTAMRPPSLMQRRAGCSETLLGRFDEPTHTITGAHFRKEKC